MSIHFHVKRVLLVDNLLFTVVGNMPKRKFTDEMYEEIAQAFEQYVLEHDDPLMQEFMAYDPVALKYHVLEDDFSAPPYPKLSELAQVAIKRQEVYMLRKGMNGQSTAMSIFRLKQKTFGYTDRLEQNITSDGERVTFFNTLPRAAKPDSKAASKPVKK